jgi:hypothetical protein
MIGMEVFSENGGDPSHAGEEKSANGTNESSCSARINKLK